MYFKRLIGMFATAGAGLYGAQSVTPLKASVTVCIEPDPYVLLGVRPATSTMFAGIGIRIDWHDLGSCPAGVSAVRVRLSRDSLSMRDLNSQTLAFAQPCARTIVVFVERVKKLHRNEAGLVMAHVLAHEITHIIEGIGRHSSMGVMKARWDYTDYIEMRRRLLSFTSEDVNLIYLGLKLPVASGAVIAPAAVACR